MSPLKLITKILIVSSALLHFSNAHAQGGRSRLTVLCEEAHAVRYTLDLISQLAFDRTPTDCRDWTNRFGTQLHYCFSNRTADRLDQTSLLFSSANELFSNPQINDVSTRFLRYLRFLNFYLVPGMEHRFTSDPPPPIITPRTVHMTDSFPTFQSTMDTLRSDNQAIIDFTCNNPRRWGSLQIEEHHSGNALSAKDQSEAAAAQ